MTRPEGRALTDLYFPQFGLHIEVDEGQHFHDINIEADKLRDADIVNATEHEIIRIDVTKSLEEINDQVDEVVEKIKEMKLNNSFSPWDIDSEFEHRTYIQQGYIDIADNVAFKTIKDACNCFGHNFSGYQRAGAPHPDPDILLWFPKLYPNGEWDNKISSDEATITERNEDNDKAKIHAASHLENKEKYKHKRIVFARVKGSLGDILYRFRGLYQLDTKKSNEKEGLIWRRVATRVNTYKQNKC